MTPVDIVRLHNELKFRGILGKPTMAISGFSGKNKRIAEYAKKAGFRIVAVSDGRVSVVDLGGNGGINVKELLSIGRKDLKDLMLQNTRRTDGNFLLKMEVDVLIIQSLDENLASEVRAKVVIQPDAGIISREANRVLKTKQVPVFNFS